MSRGVLRSLRTEGTLLLLGFVLVAGLVYAWAARSALRENSARTSSERLEEARRLARRFDSVLQLGRERLAAVAEQPGLALWLGSPHSAALPRGAAIPQRETLHYLFFHSDIFSGPVVLVDLGGALLWSEPYDAPRVDARVRLDPALLRLALAEGPPPLSPQPLPWRQGPAVVLAQPIVDLAGRRVGALLGEIDLRTSRLGSFLDERRLGPTAGAALLLENGTALLASPGLRFAPGPATLPAMGTAASVEIAGTRWLAATAPLAEAPWSTLVVEEDREALASLHHLERQLALVGFALAAAAVLLSFLALGRIVRPIEVLTAAASAVPLGDFSRPVPDRAPGELGDLSRAFLAMRRDLQSTLQGLRESEERYRSSIDSANDAIFALHPVSLGVLHVNRKAVEMVGATEAELQQRTFLDLPAADEREAARQFLARVASAGEGMLPELDLLAPDGARLPVSVSASVIVHGAGRFLQLICSDLSGRKKMERELVQAEKMSTVGMLAAGILHELNTPLAYILGNLQEARLELQQLAQAPQVLRDEIDDALEGAQRASVIARDLRIFARTQESPSQSFDINDAVRMALRMAQHELKYKARVVSELGEVPQVLGQATEISQVFLNLLVNAAHAIPPGAPAQHEVRVTTASSGGRAVACVSDTGSGIAPEVLPRIFDSFFTTKPEGVGTGLGLAISRDIVRRAGGRIEVESRPGEGTTFTVELLLAD